MINYSNLTYFKPYGTSDNWGDPNQMSAKLLKTLDSFRHRIGVPVHVTSGFRSSSSSTHGKGLAVDIVAPGFQGSLLDLFFEASRFPEFRGIGVYPDWTYKGSVVGGLHLDVRDEPLRALWIGVKNSSGRNDYHPLTSNLIQTFGGIL